MTRCGRSMSRPQARHQPAAQSPATIERCPPTGSRLTRTRALTFFSRLDSLRWSGREEAGV